MEKNIRKLLTSPPHSLYFKIHYSVSTFILRWFSYLLSKSTSIIIVSNFIRSNYSRTQTDQCLFTSKVFSLAFYSRVNYNYWHKYINLLWTLTFILILLSDASTSSVEFVFGSDQPESIVIPTFPETFDPIWPKIVCTFFFIKLNINLFIRCKKKIIIVIKKPW